jgi:hypothetical protein
VQELIEKIRVMEARDEVNPRRGLKLAYLRNARENSGIGRSIRVDRRILCAWLDEQASRCEEAKDA